MRIGTVRPEEARVFDSDAGFHQFKQGTDDAYGSFEVFWNDTDEEPGWYWWACFPGCTPDGEAHGPFSTSGRALADALEDE